MSNWTNIQAEVFGLGGNATTTMINAEFYEAILKPYFAHIGFKAEALSVFCLTLPFWVPVPDGSSYTFPGDSDLSKVTLYFSSVSKPLEIHFAYDAMQSPLSVRCSVVELIYSSSVRPVDLDSAYLTKCFDVCLERLNTFVSAYIALSKDYRAYRLSPQMFDPLLACTHFDLPKWDQPRSGAFMLHTQIPTDPSELSPEEVGRLVRLAYIRMNSLNPLMTAVELMVAAKRHLHSGFYAEAVMVAQASVESFVRTAFRLALSAEGVEDHVVTELLENTAFMMMIKKELPPRFGGNWNLAGSGPVATWYAGTYRLRNRVSHGGYIPQFQESLEAIESACIFQSFLAERIKINKERYPNLAQLLS